MARSLNRVQLIGNLTRDPELRYTPSGTAVCTFGLATNRAWTTDGGEKHEEAEFHRIVAWNKLAELCSQFLTKGRKVFVEGRLSTRSWNAQDGTQKSVTEIVISDMILLDSRRTEGESHAEDIEEKHLEEEVSSSTDEEKPKASKKADKKEGKEEVVAKPASAEESDEIVPDDIPF
jgi:single-strand DNA-binding protein